MGDKNNDGITKLGYNVEQYRIGQMIGELKEKIIKNGQERRIMEEELELLSCLQNEILRKELRRYGLSDKDIEDLVGIDE